MDQTAAVHQELKLRLMPAYTHGGFMAFKSLPDLKSLPPSYSTDFPGMG